MDSLSHRIRRALTANGAQTAPDADDPRLRGRTYGIPFEQVWRAASELAGGGLRRWRIVSEDDQAGRIRAEARPLLSRTTVAIQIRIGLDRDAQTRVDVRSVTRSRRIDFGANARRIAKFLRTLDRALSRSSTLRSSVT